jgi:hypothetical protein
MARPPVNAVYILWLRQLKRYFRSRARMIGSLGQPTRFLIIMSPAARSRQRVVRAADCRPRLLRLN